MLKKIGSIVLALAVALFAAATPPRRAIATSELKPIYAVVEHPVPLSAQRLSLDMIRSSIRFAGTQRQWRFETGGPGVLLATQEARGWKAKVKVTYSQKAYSISLVDTNFPRDSATIHPKYNQWVHNLEKDIEAQLAVGTGHSK
jgi:hypothetical protein